MDDRLRVAHNIIKDKNGKKKTQKRANIDCRCKKGNCQWTSHNKAGLALDGEFRDSKVQLLNLFD